MNCDLISEMTLFLLCCFSLSCLFLQVTWRPYLTEGTEGQPWVVEGSHLFDSDIYLHALNIVEPLYVSLVMRTRGLIQANVDFTELEQRRWLSVKYTGFAEIDWADQFDDAFLTWIEG